MSDLNFDEIFAKVKEKVNYSKHDTIEFLRRMLSPIMDKPFDSVFSTDAVDAIKPHLKGNMATHLNRITISDLFSIAHGGRPSTTRLRRARSTAPIDYEYVMKLLVDFLGNGKTASASEIKGHLKSSSNIKMTTGQWQSFRKKLPLKVGSFNWDLEKVGGDKAQTRWKIIKVK
ncbi:MAG: hypothetical protein JXR95_13070 [Deltaproteobacteria bacterium]|nr:hypothetical protein [Deltaproteobacteria bacterium]